MVERLDELRIWEQQLVAEQEEVARQLEPLLSRRDAVRAKLELVERLIQLEIGNAAGVSSDAAFIPSSTQSNSATESLLRAVELVLAERGEPMHLREIRAALARRGVPIPGRGTDANLIVHLRRSDRFQRRARGTYALSDSTARHKREVA